MSVNSQNNLSFSQYTESFSFEGDLSLSQLSLKTVSSVAADALGSPILPKVDCEFDDSKFSPGKGRKSPITYEVMASRRSIALTKNPTRLVSRIQEKIRQIHLAAGLSFTSRDATLVAQLEDLKTCINKEAKALSFSDVELKRIKMLLNKKIAALQNSIRLKTGEEFQELSLELTRLKNKYIDPLAAK